MKRIHDFQPLAIVPSLFMLLGVKHSAGVRPSMHHTGALGISKRKHSEDLSPEYLPSTFQVNSSWAKHVYRPKLSA